MFQNQIIQTIVELQKKGIPIYLTDAGYVEFLKLMHEDFKPSEFADKKNAV